MKKKLMIFMIILSMNIYSSSSEVDLYSYAVNKSIKNQIFMKDKIYKIYTTLFSGTAINFSEDEKIESAVFGDGIFWGAVIVDNQLIIKPKEVNTKTTLFVQTDKNKYYFNAVSSDQDLYNVGINFIYPDEIMSRNLVKQETEIELEKINIEDLNFNYSYKTRESWSPSRIFDDGVRTYIFLSEKDKDIPVFYEKKAKELLIVLGRVKNSRENSQRVMVLDKVFREGVLALNKKTIRIKNKSYGRR